MEENTMPRPDKDSGVKTKKTMRRLSETAKALPRELVIAFVLVVALCCAITGAAGFAVGRNMTADDSIVAEKKKLDDEYQRFSKLAEQAKDGYDSIEAQYENANDIILEANDLGASIDDLKKQKDDIDSQLKTAQSQLSSLQGKVEAAKKRSAGDGVWQVGKDIEAGTYRANNPVPGDCYWAISVGDDIVQNDLPGGGYPQTTVSDGQQLKLNGCGVWSKQ